MGLVLHLCLSPDTVVALLEQAGYKAVPLAEVVPLKESSEEVLWFTWKAGSQPVVCARVS